MPGVGPVVRDLLRGNVRPRDILTRSAFENAAAAIAAIGGSTNGVLHLLALAREAEVAFGLRDMQAISVALRSLLLRPARQETMVDLHRLGGTPVLLKHLSGGRILEGQGLTVTGRTWREIACRRGRPSADQDLVAPAEAPFKPFADIQICFGNLAPEGIVFKVSSMQDPRFRGRGDLF
jgi:dihydroxy-acid dehydratase